jgi:hypothetical protein
LNQSTQAIILIILIFIILIVTALFVTSFLVKRAVRDVINIFRKNQALTPDKAMKIDELGLQARSFLQFRGLRDYKPSALEYLMKNNIVLMTEDQRLYLSEEALFQSNIEQNISGKRA